MLKNYIKTALRNLWRNKTFSIINILGLSLGLLVCLLIMLYTKDELTYDAFHENKNELYQLTCKISEKGGDSKVYGVSGPVHGTVFKAQIPEIKEAIRVHEKDMIVKRGNEVFEQAITWVDDSFFRVLTFPLVKGDSKTVLKDIYSIVLTEEMAIKYFGSIDVIGKTLELEVKDKFETFTISGVAKSAPQNSSIKFKMLASFNYQDKNRKNDGWFMIGFPTFLVINSKADLKAVVKKMNKVYEVKANELADEVKGLDINFDWDLQPLLKMHLNPNIENSPEQSDPIYSYILSAIALLILLIACINFVNLTVAQSLRRAKEIGVRKVIGGSRKQLIYQFLGESFVICFIAFLSGIILAQICLPLFNELTNKQLKLEYMIDAKLVAGIAALFLITVLAAGFYPALVLSGFNPVETLYRKTNFSGKNYLSKALIVLQFCLATFLIISTLFIYKQFDYLTHKELGYNPKNLLLITTGRDDDKKLMNVFKNEFLKIPGVIAAAPRMNGQWTTRAKSNGKETSVRYEHIDEDYLATLGVPILEGRNFSKDFPADSTNSVLVNEAYVKEVGWKGSAVGKTIDYLNGSDTKLYVVGVVKNYHYESLREEIKPQLFSTEPHLEFGRFMVRIEGTQIGKTKDALEKTFQKLVPFHPFDCKYLEDLVSQSYEAEAKWKQIIALSAILTIFISCIGLFGLTMLSVQKRIKEIGLRKVLGAGILELSLTITRNFAYLILLSFLLAIPLAWYSVNLWFENFAYHVDVQWQVFALATCLILVFAIITLSFQTLKAAMSNPVKNLRTE